MLRYSCIIRLVPYLCNAIQLVISYQSSYRVSKKLGNYSITFEQMATQRCVRSQIGGIFWCSTHLDHCQNSSMSSSCIYTCLNIYNPLSNHLFKSYADFLTSTFFWDTLYLFFKHHRINKKVCIEVPNPVNYQDC